MTEVERARREAWEMLRANWEVRKEQPRNVNSGAGDKWQAVLAAREVSEISLFRGSVKGWNPSLW